MTTQRIVTVALLIAAAGWWCEGRVAFGALRFKPDNSTATITHDLDEVPSMTSSVNVTTFPITTDSGSAQYPFATLTDGTVTSNAAGGLGYEKANGLAEAIFSDGSGVDQTDSSGAHTNESKLNLNFDILFKVRNKNSTAGVAGAELIWAGTVGTGGSVNFSGTIDYYNDPDKTDGLPGTLISSVPLSMNYSKTTAGVFSESIFGSTVIDSVPKGNFMRIIGDITFEADNANGPTDGFFDPDFEVQASALSGRQSVSKPSIATGTFASNKSWKKGAPALNSIVVLHNPMTSMRTMTVTEDIEVQRIEMSTNSLNQSPMVLEVAADRTLTVTRGIAMQPGARIVLGANATLNTGRSLLAADVQANGGTINVMDKTAAFTGSFSNMAGTTLHKMGPGGLVLYENNTALAGMLNVMDGKLQLQSSEAGGTAGFDLESVGVLGANFNFKQTLIDRITPTSAGTLALVRTEVDNGLDLSAMPDLALGATDRAILSAPITPHADSRGHGQYRFRSVGGRLDVTSVLQDQPGGPSDLNVHGGSGGMINFSGSSTFTGGLIFGSDPTIGIGSGTALGLGQSPVSVGSTSVVFTDPALDATVVSRPVVLEGTGDTTNAQVGWDGDKLLTNPSQVGTFLDLGPRTTHVLGLGAEGDSGTLTLGFDVSDDTVGLPVPGALLRLALGGDSMVDIRNRINTHSGGTRVHGGTVMANSFDNFGGAPGATGKQIDMDAGAALMLENIPVPGVRAAVIGDTIRVHNSIENPTRRAVGYVDNGVFVDVRVASLGDSDLSGLVSDSDFDTTAANFNLAAGAQWQDGDSDYNGQVDNDDVANVLAHLDKFVLDPLDTTPQGILVYDPSNGNVKLTTPAGEGTISNFVLRNLPGGDDFNFTAFIPPVPSPLVTSNPLEISWSDLDGFQGTADLGNIFPPGKSVFELMAMFINGPNRLYVGEPGSGRGVLIFPEPATGLMLVPVLAALVCRRRR